MLYDVIMEETSIVISQNEIIAPDQGDRLLSVRVCAENNSYLPQGDRFVSLYLVRPEEMDHAERWELVRTAGGGEESELEYAYPMQQVWTKEDFILRVPAGEEFCLIARINDGRRTLSRLPENGFAEVKERELWSVRCMKDCRRTPEYAACEA